MFESFSFPSSLDEQTQCEGHRLLQDECDGQELIAPHTRSSGRSAQTAMSDAAADADYTIVALSQSLDRQNLGDHSRLSLGTTSHRPNSARRPSIQRSTPQDYAAVVRQSRQSYTQLHCRTKHLVKVASVVERILAEGTANYDTALDSRRSSSDVSDSMLPTPDENYANRDMMDLSAASSSESENPISTYGSTASPYRPLELKYRKTSFQRERAGNVVEKKIRMRKRKVVGGQGVRNAG